MISAAAVPSAGGREMLKMTDVGKVYRTGLIETAALSGMSLEVARGDFVSLMGPSGSGKTTFLNIAGLLDTFDVGSYWLDGVEVSALNDDRQSRLRNERIGFIFQSFNLIPDLDVYDNVEVPLRYRKMAMGERRDRVEEMLVQMGLTARMRHLPSQLSGGQQQRVAFARALVGKPQLLLADEPTGNLDTIASRQVLDLLETINGEQQTTIVMVTHDPTLAARARRKLHVLDGKLIDPQAADRPLALAMVRPHP
jgi:putative ABC transport system ATP-binding protein